MKFYVEVLRNEVAMKEEQIRTTGVRERELQEELKGTREEYAGYKERTEKKMDEIEGVMKAERIIKEAERE